jgi:hypothetical protein
VGVLYGEFLRLVLYFETTGFLLDSEPEFLTLEHGLLLITHIFILISKLGPALLYLTKEKAFQRFLISLPFGLRIWQLIAK